MKIVQINTDDISGGAAKAAYRLHKGLRQAEIDCRMLVRNKISTDESVLAVGPQKSNSDLAEDLYLRLIQEQYINAHRTNISNTLFSLPYPGYDLSQIPLVGDADVINLHWIAYFQSIVTLQKLSQLGKPIVWTLHDQWAFTGGCHYSAGCTKYREDCSACPQLSDDPFDLAAAVLKDKLDLFKEADLTIVTPSKWLADCARESLLFKNCRVEVIPNSLETDIFSPIPKAGAKQGLGISTDTVTFLFGAQAGGEKRKGFSELMTAMEECKAHPDFQKLLNNNKIMLLCFGHPDEQLKSSGIPVVSLGYLSSDEKVRDAYSAADMFILPSQEDNLPNTMLEALSCETPVVAFNVGGIPDVVQDDVNGKLVPAHDTKLLAGAMLDLLSNPEKRSRMGKNGRKQILEGYALHIQAKNYLSLYKELLDNISQAKTVAPPPEDPKDMNASGTAALDISIGPHFQEIYDKTFLKTLKEHIRDSEKRLDACEADRAARLDIINRVNAELEICEKDRAARLDVINALDAQVKEYQRKYRGGF